jgi:ubiquitin-like 1-activating enzyme E1 B
VFDADIRNLLIMSDMWRARAPPVPLDFDAILDGTFVLRSEEPPATPTVPSNGKTNGVAKPVNAVASGSGSKTAVNGAVNTSSDTSAPAAGSGLKDQKQLSLKDNVLLFISR